MQGGPDWQGCPAFRYREHNATPAFLQLVTPAGHADDRVLITGPGKVALPDHLADPNAVLGLAVLPAGTICRESIESILADLRILRAPEDIADEFDPKAP